jgi:extracellular factor (EF) 3-hydroxypalmitic acid methyl ester biosynthesis protein
MSTASLIQNGGDRETLISCRNSQGAEIRATPVRITRYTVVFEVYNPFSILQLSEVLSEFRISIGERLAYNGRAVVSNIVNAGIMVLCEATLEESWLEIDLFSPISQPDRLRAEFAEFMVEWAKIRAVLPEFKVTVADFQTLLLDLRRWLDQVELGVRSEASGARADMERSVLLELESRMLPEIEGWMTRFDEVANGVPDEARPAHRAYARRQLHPLVLCAPFVYRTFQKPLGYAGDYEMVNMILRDPHEGATMFAKLVNVCFLQNPPAAAHRNRIKFLKRRLAEETRRVMSAGRRIQILNMGCGPAREVREFLAEDAAADMADFQLFDFNPQTLDYTRTTLAETRARHGRRTGMTLSEKSINQLLKEAAKATSTMPGRQYDLVYCAGLYDYVSDRVCRRLNELFYHLLAPGGLMIVTNVDASKPFRHSMDFLLEWHLIYRNRPAMSQIIPAEAAGAATKIDSDPTGVNLFLEIRKPAAP